MPPKPEDVLKLAEDIVKAKEALAALEEQWVELFAVSSPSVTHRATRDNSFASQVEAVLTREPERVFTIGQVAQALHTDDTLKVGRTLFRLYITNRIHNNSRGLYSARRPVEVAA